MDNDFREAIGREQLRLVMQQVPTMQAASVVVALVLSYAVRGIVPRGNILSFILLVSAVAAGRFVLYRRFLVACTKSFVEKNWKSAYLLLALSSGIVWGGSAFLILPRGNAPLLALFLLVMTSLSASTTVSHSSIKWAPAVWIVPALLLYAIRCVLDGGEYGILLAFLLVLYLVVMLQYSLKHHGTIASSIALRFENLKLLEESRQGEERMRVILDSTDDGILAVDASGKTIFSNRRFSELWRIPQSLADTRDDDAMLGFVLEQLVDPEDFLRKVKRLYGTPEINDDTILFKDGRLFERYSMPMMDEGAVIGRLWSFRDITDRKQADEEKEKLRAQLQQAMKMEAVGRLAGGRGARLQQSSDGHHGKRFPGPHEALTVRSGRRPARRGEQGRGERGLADPAAVGVLPQADHQAEGLGPQLPDRRHEQDAGPPDRGGHRSEDGPRQRILDW